MLKKYLRKDLTKRAGINVVLGLFIFLATVFLSISIKNIVCVVNGIDFFIEKSNVSDVVCMMSDKSENDEIKDLLEKNDKVQDYEFGELALLLPDQIKLGQSKDGYNAKKESRIFFSTMPTKYHLTFNEENQLFEVNPGEIAITSIEAKRNHLKTGDKITFDFGSYKKEFVVSHVTKDASFGSDMAFMVRYIINEADYTEIISNVKGIAVYEAISITTSDVREVIKDIDHQQFSSLIISITKDTIKLMYIFNIVYAAMLILVGIGFILIAFFVLRFTLIFTMEENYREIGVMQAIGIKIRKIRLLYILKYAFLVLVGATLGLIVSIPLSDLILRVMTKSMVISEGNGYLWTNVIGALSVVVIVILFSYRCTAKIKKMSVINTIRGGALGERYKKRRGIQLNRKRRMSVSIFLGINDAMINMKRYLALMVTFSVCFVLITIPLNTINTMTDDSMAKKFDIDPQCDVLVTSFQDMGPQADINVTKMDQYVMELKDELNTLGYQPHIITPYYYSLNYKIDGTLESILTLQIREEVEFLEYIDGCPPVLENEIAMSKQMLKSHHLQIGDTVKIVDQGVEKEYLITGSYSDYLQTGNSARLNPVSQIAKEKVLFMPIMIYLGVDTNMSKTQICEQMKAQLPEYGWSTVQENLDSYIGQIKDTFNASLVPMTVAIAIIIALVVLMMEQLFIVREKGEIAMLKSIGFKNGAIRWWQSGRMVLAALLSMVAAVPLSMLCNQFLLKPIFEIMGAEVDIIVKPFDAYVLFPGLLFIVIIIATLIATLRVRNIKIQDLNNLE